MSAARSPDHRPGHVPQQAWEKIAGFAFGVMFVAAILVLAIAFPQPTSFQYEVFRIVLAIACGGVAAVIPGFLAISMDAKGLVIRAGGALAVFLLVYFFSPARLVSSTSPPVSQPNITATDHSIAAGGDITATAQLGGTAIITTGNVILDAKAIAESLLKAHEERELAGFHEREQAYQDQVKALTNTIAALAQQQRQPNAPPGIEEALTQLQQGHTAAAETIFETVLARKAAEGQAANQQAAEAARHLGALAFLHDTEKALTAYRRAIELDPANAEGWNQLGNLLYRIGQLDEAVDAYNQVLLLGKKVNNHSILASAYGGLGNVNRIRGDLDQAEAKYHEVLTLYEVIGHKEGIATTYGNLGIIYEIRGDLNQAEAMHRKALRLNKELDRKRGIASTYINLGIIYQIRGDLNQAEAKQRKALTLYKALDDKEGIASIYGNLGSVYRFRGDLDQAEAKHRKALTLYEVIGHKEGIATTYGNLGVVFRIRGDLDQAEAKYHEALKLFEVMGNKDGMANQYNNLGIVYRMKGDLDQAEAKHRKALTLYEALRYKQGIASTYGNLGNVYYIRGDLDQAEAKYHEALKLFEVMGNKDGMAKQHGNLGNVYYIRGDLDQTEAILRKALRLFQEIGAAPEVERVQKSLRILRAQDSP